MNAPARTHAPPALDDERQHFFTAIETMLVSPGLSPDTAIEIGRTICVVRRIATLAAVRIDA
jgi:hypothetical protein